MPAALPALMRSRKVAKRAAATASPIPTRRLPSRPEQELTELKQAVAQGA
ncbi:MAG: hypothetical protein ACLR7U_07140 [Ruthenibacterium lactatiformans]